jgi:lysophospholipase L1-like esterase
MNLNDLRILLIGDSITEGFNANIYLPELNITNKGFSGDSTQETLKRISSDWFVPAPHIIFICIGTNDIARGRDDDFILEGIKSIIDKIRTHTSKSKIVFTSIFPTLNNQDRPNKRIVNFNYKLKNLTISKNILFFNLNKHFSDREGELINEFTNDGLHLNNDAYKYWAIQLFEFISLTNIN